MQRQSVTVSRPKRERAKSKGGSRPKGHPKSGTVDLKDYVPNEVGPIENHQTALPRIARDSKLTDRIDAALRTVPTTHRLFLADARKIGFLKRQSVHLVVTSPPYWTLKEYRKTKDQLGYVADYERFLKEIDKVWRQCYRLLVPGGRLVVVVGDVCLARRKAGRHVVVPLHASVSPTP
jgi:hypothetical protein